MTDKHPTEPDAHASPDQIKAEFGLRLQKALNAKGWNQSELARRMAPHLPRTSIARDNISKYVRGKVLPQPLVLEAKAVSWDVALAIMRLLREGRGK
jgi:transcriptional regulator with XRE-family HTH domain